MAKSSRKGRGRSTKAGRRPFFRMPAVRLRWPGWRGLMRRAGQAALILFTGFVLLVILFRFVNPVMTPHMIAESWRRGEITRDWVPIEEIDSRMARSAVAAEDANFCLHWGFDMRAIRAALDEGAGRGASTISQQVVKNVFLWQGRSWPRKALEALMTPVVEIIWPKERILEIYLNVAETGPGVFGVQSAAERYYGRSAAELSATQAGLIAAALPFPAERNPAKPTRFLKRRAAAIAEGAATIAADGRAACFGG